MAAGQISSLCSIHCLLIVSANFLRPTYPNSKTAATPSILFFVLMKSDLSLHENDGCDFFDDAAFDFVFIETLLALFIGIGIGLQNQPALFFTPIQAQSA